MVLFVTYTTVLWYFRDTTEKMDNYGYFFSVADELRKSASKIP